MRKVRFRSFFYDAVFVLVVMAAAMASAVLEAGAVLGGFSIDAVPTARSAPPSAQRPASASSSVDGALLSVAAPRSAS
jgi:hypothetical protein